MKKQFINAIERKCFTLFASFVIVFCSFSRSYALPDRPTNVAKTAEISYKGLKDDALVFKVDFKNEAAQPFVLVIKNETDVIYSKSFKGKALNSDVLVTEVPENCKLSFTIRAGNKDYTQNFEINSKTKVVEELLVKGI